MSRRIPEGWSFWCAGAPNTETAWLQAIDLKHKREILRPDLFVRVMVVKGPGGARWILRKEETRAKEIAA